MMEETKEKKNWVRSLLIILAVLALGFLLVNQGLGFVYKVHFLKSPCALCGELNPDVEVCIKELNDPRASYYNSMTGWEDPFKEKQIVNLSLP